MSAQVLNFLHFVNLNIEANDLLYRFDDISHFTKVPYPDWVIVIKDLRTQDGKSPDDPYLEIFHFLFKVKYYK